MSGGCKLTNFMLMFFKLFDFASFFSKLLDSFIVKQLSGGYFGFLFPIGENLFTGLCDLCVFSHFLYLKLMHMQIFSLLHRIDYFFNKKKKKFS